MCALHLAELEDFNNKEKTQKLRGTSYIFLITAIPLATSISNSLGVGSKRLNVLLKLPKQQRHLVEAFKMFK